MSKRESDIMIEKQTDSEKVAKVYHCSPVANLTELTPRVSTHGKSYVYGTKNFALSLLFSSNKSMGDLDGNYGENLEGKPYFYEAYKGALKRRFENVMGYVYEVDSTYFQEGKTSFKAEVVSEEPVKVLNCTKVDDVYATLLDLIEKGEMEFKEWNAENADFVKRMDDHIYGRIKLFRIYEYPQSNDYKFALDKFPHILKRVELEIPSDK